MRLKNQILSVAIAAVSLAGSSPVFAADGGAVHGVTVTYTAGDRSDTATAPNVWLYVAKGGTPSPFLPAGPFTATFEGHITVDLRGNYAFQADLNGALKLEINGTTALDVTGTGGASATGEMIRLNKGENAFKATFTPPAEGDAFLRLNWQPKDSFIQPIPLNQLGFAANDALASGNKLRLGRELVAEHHCVACHTVPGDTMPELKTKGPSLDGIGGRRQFDWLAKWIADPKSLRANAHMPKLLHGETTEADSRAIAAYLVSLGSGAVSAPKEPAAEAVEAGGKLFQGLHCTACHVTGAPGPNDLHKITLAHTAQKFSDESLLAFLKKPSEHYPWIKMPEFKLKDDQLAQLAAYVLSVSAKPAATAAPTSADVLARQGTRPVHRLLELPFAQGGEQVLREGAGRSGRLHQGLRGRGAFGQGPVLRLQRRPARRPPGLRRHRPRLPLAARADGVRRPPDQVPQLRPVPRRL